MNSLRTIIRIFYFSDIFRSGAFSLFFGLNTETKWTVEAFSTFEKQLVWAIYFLSIIMMEYFVNRRLGESQDHRILKRYKTTDTRISNSRKLPRDFFSCKKTTLTLKQESVHENWLPPVKLSFGKSKSM